MRQRIITKSVWVLSIVSFLTDISSEMLYPITPLYLSAIGYSALWIGILEGVAEAVSGLSKGYFGNLSDKLNTRVPFVKLGYALSSFSKPVIGFITSPFAIFSARVTDRLGKGIRTGARDAILAGESTNESASRVFGLHRAMDTLGAAIGPIIALFYLKANEGNYSALYLFAFIPAIIGVAFTFLLKDKPGMITTQKKKSIRANFTYWKHAPIEYKKLFIGLCIFAIVNSSDVFLLMKMKSLGYDDTTVLLVYIFYNLVYALMAYPIGVWSDKKGNKVTLLTGLIFFTIAYACLPFATDQWHLYVIFFIYGLYAACTEGISKAWISKLVPRTETGGALGFYSGVSSVLIFFSSSLAGFFWLIDPSLPFIIAAAGAMLSAIYIKLIVE